MNKEKVLIIDDDEIVRKAITDLLKDEGYRVTVAVTGEDGIEKAKNGAFDLVLTDLKLPGKDGIAVLREIKALEDSPTVILMTGYASLETAKDAIRIGALNYITKPIDPEKLMPLVREALEQREKAKAREPIEKPNILLVDDDSIVRKSVRDILEDNGYGVDTAETPEEALEKLSKQAFQILIVDLKLPGMSGMELIKRARDISSSEFMPVIITGFPSIESVVEAMKSGVYEYITKPVEAEQLIKILGEVWGRWKTDVTSKLLKPGGIYLIKEEKPDRSFDIFAKLTRLGLKGLCVSTLHPDMVKDKCGSDSTKIVWLSKQQSLDSIPKVAMEILDFIKSNMDSVILLDGVEYLISHWGFSAVTKTLDSINEVVMLEKARLIIPINPYTLDTREMATLERGVVVYSATDEVRGFGDAETKSLEKNIEALYRDRRKKDKEKQERVLKMLRDEEKRIIELVINSGGEMYQSKLIESTGLSSAKVTRLLDKLESKGLVERKRDGMSNVISFKKL
jgi:DNA-binding response OmpR family regulator/DNA-binding transcriptional ArsR family regulator